MPPGIDLGGSGRMHGRRSGGRCPVRRTILRAALLGFVVATPLYILLFLRLYGGAGWIGSAALAVGMTFAMVGISWLLRADLYPGILSGA